MSSTAFFKRILPFVAAFAVGVFIASFFVTISGPRFGKRGPGNRHGEVRRLRMEVERLQMDNDRLREQIEALNGTSLDPAYSIPAIPQRLGEVPPPPPMPAAPKARN